MSETKIKIGDQVRIGDAKAIWEVCQFWGTTLDGTMVRLARVARPWVTTSVRYDRVRKLPWRL